MTATARSPLQPLERLVPRAASTVRRSPARRLLVWSRHRGLSEQDVMLASFPRSGNTWMRGMLVDLLVDGEVDLARAERTARMVGEQRNAPSIVPGGGRLLKTHEPRRPEYHRVVYVVRHPADVNAAYRAFDEARGRPQPATTSGVASFLDRPIDGYGSWRRHVESYLDLQRSSTTIVVRYEDLLVDPVGQLSAVAAFLGVSADAERDAAIVARHGSARVVERAAGVPTSLLGRRFDPRRSDAPKSHVVDNASLASTASVRERLGYARDT